MPAEAFYEQVRRRMSLVSLRQTKRKSRRAMTVLNRSVAARATARPGSPSKLWNPYRAGSNSTPWRRAESRDCLLEMTRALMRGAKRAAEEAEKGEACTKELKELAGILQTLAGLEKELGGGTAVQTVQVLMGEGVRALSE